ncbi:MAG TPA: Calx-beta domain-containing protein, partial [Pirellula sp.]|nr:Calx-beta domain-containing protein [Pirellula sp.]
MNTPAFPILGDPQIFASLATASVGILDDKVALIRISSVAAGMEPSTSGTFVVDLVRTVDQVNVLQPVQQVISKVNTVVTYTVSGTAQPGVSAGGGNDYAQLTVLGTGTVTITAGQSSAFISVNVFDDLQLEPTETVVITLQGKLSGDASSIISPIHKVATVNILDDDSYVLSIARTGRPPTEPGSIGAGGSDGQFTVTLTKNLPSPLIVVIEDVTTIGLGKAKLGTGAGADYNYGGSTNKFQTVTIQPGQTQATMTITVIDDLVSEGDETIDVRIDGFSYAPVPGISILVIPDSGPATIYDNDVMNVLISTTNGRDKIVGSDNGQFLFSTGGISSLYDTFVTYSVRTAGATATAGTDYTAIPAGSFTLTRGQTTAAILLQVLEDTEVEEDETVQIEVLSVTSSGPNPLMGVGNTGTATIVDEDLAKIKLAGSANASEPSGLGFFTIEQSAKSSTNTVIEFSITGGTATPQVDFTIPAPVSVTIAAGQTRAFIPVQALDDTMLEVGVETVQLTLASSTKLGDPQITVDGANRVATINIMDADVAKVLFTKVQDGAEGGSNGIFNVSLVHATSLLPLRSDLNVIVTYEISGTSKGGASSTNGVNGPDYQQLSVSRIGTLTIPALQTSATIGVTVFEDDFVESLENVTIRQLSVTTASPRAVSLNTQSAVVTAKSDTSGAFATLTANNNFIAGQQVVVAIGDPAFDGTFQIISATSTNFNYFKGNSTAVPNATPASGVAAITTPLGTSNPVSSQIISQSLTGNVATISTSGAHGLLPGQIVTIALAQASTIYDGTFVLLPGTAGTTLFYSRSLADQPGSTFTGTVFNRSNGNMLISDNDSSTLTFNSA